MKRKDDGLFDESESLGWDILSSTELHVGKRNNPRAQRYVTSVRRFRLGPTRARSAALIDGFREGGISCARLPRPDRATR